jgi:uncharacterized protein YbjT (DUF2867 family)
MTLIAVTGATGHVGRVIAETLLARGVGVRALGRSAERLRDLASKGAEPRVVDVHDARSLEPAFGGADAVFAMIPPNYAVPDLRAHHRSAATALANAVRAAGVPRVVTLSSLGAQYDQGVGPVTGLHDMEQVFDAIPGLHGVHLRPGFFMENLLATIPVIRQLGVMAGSWPADRAMVMIATRDIGRIAAGLLASPDFTGRSVRELAGPRLYTQREAARVVGQAIGRADLAYVELPYDQTRQYLVGAGFSAGAAESFIELVSGTAQGRLDPTGPIPAAQRGQTTLEQFAREVFAPAFAAG